MNEKQQDEKIVKQSVQMACYMDSELKSGVSEVYERNKYVDAAKMRESKKNEFAGKKTTTTYTGDVVHSSAKAAENKYKKNASFHQSETDHIMPVKHVYDRHKNSAWLSDDDLRDVINAKSNLKEVSRYINRSKKDMTHFEYIVKNWNGLSKEQIAALGKEQVKADILLESSVVMKKAKNISIIAGEGAKNGLIGAAPGLLVKGARDIRKVADGEMEAEEAIVDMAGTVGKVVMAGAATGVMKKQVGNIAAPALQTAEKILKMPLDAPVVGQITGAVMVLKDCAVKFAKGEIESGEFFMQMMEDGTGYILSTIVYYSMGPVGIAAGIAVSTVVTVVQNIYDSIKQELRMCRNSKKELAEAEKVTKYILEKERKYQEMLIDFRNTLEKNREKSFDELLFSMRQSLMRNDIDSLFSGINTFGESYGIHFQFGTFQEFEDFMNDEDAIFQF